MHICLRFPPQSSIWKWPTKNMAISELQDILHSKEHQCLKARLWRSFQLMGKHFPNHPCENDVNGLFSPSLTKGVNCLQWHCLHPSCPYTKYTAVWNKGDGCHIHSRKVLIALQYQALFWFIPLLPGVCERDSAVFLVEESMYLWKQVHQKEWIKI